MGWVGATVKFIASIWGYIKAVATVAYVIYLWQQKKKANRSPTYGFDIQTQCSNELPIPVVYGRVKAAGNIIWQKMSDDKSTIYAFVAFSEGPIEGFEDVRANDILIDELPGCSYTPYLGTPDQLIDSRCPGNPAFFEHIDYGGKVITLSPGDYTAADLAAAGLVLASTNDDGTESYYGSWMSAVKTNYHRVTLYSGANFNGDSWVLSGDTPRLTDLGANDRVYSLKIEPLTNADRAKLVGGLRNVAYIAFTIAASDKISGGMPNFTAIVKGRKVPVWESATQSWVTKYIENQAWHLLDLLTHTRYGGGYTDTQINIESFKTAATFCDEILPDGQPRFAEGIIIDWVDPLPDIVDQIRFTCRGYIVSYNGKLTFKIEQPEAPCQHFDMENIVEDSLEIYMPGKDEEWQKVTVTYCEPGQNWAKIPAQSVDESNPLHPVQKDFTIVGVNRFSQASRLAYFYRVYSKYCRFSGKFKTTIRALNRIPGDVITISDDIMGWVNKPVRILEIRHAGDHGHEIYFREYNETIYNDAMGSAEPTINYSELPNPFVAPNDPTDLKLKETTFLQKSGEVITEIVVTFSPYRYMFYAYSLIQISGDGNTWNDLGSSIDGVYSVHGLQSGKTYWIKVKTVTTSGICSNGVIASILVTGKDQPPSNVPNFTLTQSGSFIKVTVEEPEDPDIDHYELRLGPSWKNSVLIKNMFLPNDTIPATQEGTQTFWIKAVDRSGLKSINPTKNIIIISGLPPKNIIAERTENITTWQTTGMFYDYALNCWMIDSQAKVGDFTYFADIFESDGGASLRIDAEAILPPLDVGPSIIPEGYFYYSPYDGQIQLYTTHDGVNPATLDDYVDFWDLFAETPVYLQPPSKFETTATVDIDWQQSSNNYISIYYRTSFDNITYNDWSYMENHQFFGRYIQIKLVPGSLDGKTNVRIYGCRLSVDVPDVTEKIPATTVSATGATRVNLTNRYWAAPFVKIYSQDNYGKSCTYEIVDGTAKQDVDRSWYFEIRLWDGATQITGKIYGEVEGY